MRLLSAQDGSRCSSRARLTALRFRPHKAAYRRLRLRAVVTWLAKVTGMPSTPTGKLASIRMPLAFDPGERWEYRINTDWVGRIVETASGNLTHPVGVAARCLIPRPHLRPTRHEGYRRRVLPAPEPG